MEPLITDQDLAELIRAEALRYRQKAEALEALVVESGNGGATRQEIIVPRSVSGMIEEAARGAAPRRRAKSKLSGRVLAMRKLQGRYMGYVRNLTVREKARVSKIREKFGYQRAIKLAAKLAR